jgi:hypothetical protein
LSPETKIVLIGYSGGGSRATWIANEIFPRRIDLLVAYDPSPAWQMRKLPPSGGKAICYRNTRPLMFGLGGGALGGGYVETHTLAQQALTTFLAVFAFMLRRVRDRAARGESLPRASPE